MLRFLYRGFAEASPKLNWKKLAVIVGRPLPDIDSDKNAQQEGRVQIDEKSFNGLYCFAGGRGTLDERSLILMTYLLTATCVFITVLLPGFKVGDENKKKFPLPHKKGIKIENSNSNRD